MLTSEIPNLYSFDPQNSVCVLRHMSNVGPDNTVLENFTIHEIPLNVIPSLEGLVVFFRLKESIRTIPVPDHITYVILLIFLIIIIYKQL